MTLVMLAGLLLLAGGAIDLARRVWRAGLPRWSGVAFASGLALWLPVLPRPVRIVDGLLIGLGGVWLAWGLWRTGSGPAAGGAVASPAAAAERAVAHRAL